MSALQRSLGLAAGALLAACGGDPRVLGTQQQAVVGGTADPGDPAVVAFVADGYMACSGSLIAPTAVLTAGHCANALGNVPYTVAFGSVAASPTESVPVIEQVLHPQYSGEGKPYDFALLHLGSPVTDVAPLPLSSTPLTAADVGTSIRHVGFGVSDPMTGDGAGTKREVTYPITEVDPDVVWSGALGEQTCTGDSGGPGFITRDGVEQIAGVVSDGPDCYDAGWDGRVDLVVDWIASTTAPWMPDAGPADGGVASGKKAGGGCESTSGSPLGFFALALLLSPLSRRRRRCERGRGSPLYLAVATRKRSR